MDQTNSFEQQARDLFNKRRTALMNNASESIINYLQEIPIFVRTERLINKIHTKPELVQEFLLHLIIATTRVWEAYNKDEEGKFYFQSWTTKNKQCELLNMIERDSFFMQLGLDEYNPIQIKPIIGSQKESLLKQVESQLLKNIKTIQTILNEAVSKDQIQTFITQVELYCFSHPVLVKYLNGLSTYDGTKMYFSQRLHIAGSDNQELIRVLEHESIHSLIRYISEEKDPLFISSKKYPKLYTDNGEQTEAGDFYEMKAYEKQIIDPSPFCMQAPKMRIYK